VLVTLDLATGYGEAGAEYARGLHRVGVPVCWLPVAKRGKTFGPLFDAPTGSASPPVGDVAHADYDAELLGLLHRRVERDVLLVHAPYEWWGRCREHAPGARNVVYTTWEADRLPAAWTDALNTLDLVLVPSEFNRRAFVESGVRSRVEVVPHPARPVVPLPGAELPRIAPDDFVFYTIGEWRARKNLEETVRAYLDAFTAADPVALVIKTSDRDYDALEQWERSRTAGAPPDSTTAWWALGHVVAGYARAARVHLIAGRVPRSTIDRLHTRGDCFVSLSHGEGWGLGAFEAGLFDNPSIITGWGGHVGYLGTDYPFLVRHTLVDAAPLGPQGTKAAERPSQRWALPDRAHASELMRAVFEDAKGARAVGAALGARLRERYRADGVAEHLSRLLGFG
jgi:glycosyltransferase involved in cell wall biosynthesis